MILVVGATGHLGSLVVRRLREEGRPVRAMVRKAAGAEDLAATGAELVTADLRRPETLDAVLAGVDTVVATANVVVPTQPGDTSAALDAGYRELVTRAVRHGVRRFVIASVRATPVDDVVPVVRTKRRLERLLEDSDLSYVSLRLPALSELWLALAGSSLPLRGEQRTIFDRPYAFFRGYRRLTGATVDRHGVMLVPGPSSGRNAFISIHDAARLMTAAVDSDAVSGCVDVGGAEILSWNEIGNLFQEVLGRPVRVIGSPTAVFAVAQRVLAPFAPSVSDIMGLQRLAVAAEPERESHDVALRLGVPELRTVRDILQEKAGLPAVV